MINNESLASRWITRTRGLIAAFVLLDALLIGLIYFALKSDYLTLTSILPRASVIGLEAAFVILLIGFGLSLRYFVRDFVLFESRFKWFFWLVGPFAILLAVLLPPKTNRIYFDEFWYANIGITIAEEGLAVFCNYCNYESGQLEIHTQEYNKQPNSHPYWISLFYRLFGVSESVTFGASYVAAGILALSLFWLGRWLVGNNWAGVFAALIGVTTPMYLVWAGTFAAEPSTAAFAAVAMLAAVLYQREANYRTGVFLVGATAFFLQFRPECLLLLMPIALIVFGRRPLEHLRSSRLYFLAALLFILLVPHLLHLYAFRNHSWGSSNDRFSLEFFWHNLSVNGPYYFLNARHPLVITLLALVGVIFTRSKRLERAVVFLWFVASWLVFLFFYAGSYNYGADVRFAVLTTPSLALLAAFGCQVIVERLFAGRQEEGRRVLLFFLTVSFVSFLPLIRMVGREAREARQYVDIAREWSKGLPADSLVLSHTPNLWVLWHRNSAQLSRIKEEPGFLNQMLQYYPGGVYVDWGYWCNVPFPEQNQYCDYARDVLSLSLVEDEKMGTMHYLLYKVQPPASMKFQFRDFSGNLPGDQELVCREAQ